MTKITAMTEGKPLPLMVKFAIPMIIGNALQMLYNIADSAVVGRMIGVDAFAAVGVAGNFLWMIFSITMGISQGFGTLMAQYFGAQDMKSVRKSFTSMCWLTLGLGTIISVVAVIVSRPMVMLLQTPEEIVQDTTIYMQIYFAGFLFVFANNTFSAVLRAIGNSKAPVNIMLVSGVINIVLNIVLIKVTDWGVAAVAISTVIAQVIGAAMLWWYIRRIDILKTTREEWKLDSKMMGALMKLGGPIGFRFFVISIGGIVIQFYINGYGTNFIAGLSATKRVYALLDILGMSLTGALATFVAQNYGAKNLERIKLGMKQLGIALIVSVAAVITFMAIFGRGMVGLMIAGEPAQIEEVLNIAMEQILFMLIFLPSLYALYLFQTSIQSMGNSTLPLIGAIIEMIIRIGSVMILPLFIGKWGVYLAEVIGWPVCAIFYLFSYIFVFRRVSKRFSAEKEAELSKAVVEE